MLEDQIDPELDLYDNYNDYKHYKVFMTTLGSLKKKRTNSMALNPCFNLLLENRKAFRVALKDFFFLLRVALAKTTTTTITPPPKKKTKQTEKPDTKLHEAPLA